jgi:RNA polymerase sigma-70 factor (ECF subfamily)
MLANAQSTGSADDPIAGHISRGEYKQAVALCVETHGKSIGRLCMALLGSQPDAEEALQETFLAAHSSMPSFRGDGTVRAWLFGIARRQCARHIEKNKRHRGHLSVVPETVQSDDSPQLSVADRERIRSVRSALSTLKPSERDALLLRYQSELSYREIAEACGIDEAAARKRASRGLQRLRKTLSAEEVE